MLVAQTRLWLLTSIALCCLPAAAASKTVLLKAARLFDGHRMITPGLIVVTGNQIAGVGAATPIPPGAEVLDFGDATLSPGFMDPHTHLSGDMSLRNAIRAGIIPGPHMLVCVNAIGATGGHCDNTGFRYGIFGKETGIEVGVANGPDAVRAAVRLDVKYGD